MKRFSLFHKLALLVAVLAAAAAMAGQADARGMPKISFRVASTQAACNSNEWRISEHAILGTKRKVWYCIPQQQGATGYSHVDPFFNQAAAQTVAQLTQTVTNVIPNFFSSGRQINTQPVVVCWNKANWGWLNKMDRKLGGQGISGVMAYVYMPDRVINLAPKVCSRLNQVTYTYDRPMTYDYAEVVDTLAHESMHVASISSEARAECFAMQLTEFTAQYLNLGQDVGVQYGTILWNGYADYGKANPAYYSANCRDGGLLDLFPQGNRFP